MSTSQPILRRVPAAPTLDLGSLSERAATEGHGFVARARAEWHSGSNRFDLPGEALLVAQLGDEIVGLCGLNIDPFLGDPEVGRLRHLYVVPAHRRRGIGGRLVAACLDHAAPAFARVRLRTFDRVAAEFYVGIGFDKPRERDATHSIDVRLH